jgi:hypothetical protein
MRPMVQPVVFSHPAVNRTLAPCSAIRRPERCRHVHITFTGGE